MNSFFRTAIYSKNITATEQILRLAAAIGSCVAAAMYFGEPWLRWTAAASALMFALTGTFGFCPACYMVGRKLTNRHT